MRAIAELGPGPHRSADIANVLQRKVQSPVDEFMKRIMPGSDWLDN